MYKMYCPRITGNHNLEVAAAFYCFCRDAVGDAFNESMNCVENVNMTCSDDVVDQMFAQAEMLHDEFIRYCSTFVLPILATQRF